MFTVTGHIIQSGIRKSWVNPVTGEEVSVPQKNERDATTFFIPVAELEFIGDAVCKDLNLWPGGEWHGLKKKWSAHVPAPKGKPQDRVNQAQLWLLKRNEKLIIIDKDGRVRILRYQCDGWSLAVPKTFDVAEYIRDRGACAHHVRGVDWALRNLECMQRELDVNLSNMIDELRRKRAPM